MAAKVKASSKLWGVTKKRHGHNFQNFGSKSNQRGTMWVSSTLIRFGAEILKIVAVSFFCNTSALLKKKLKFDSTLTADNSGLKPSKLKNSHIFGILRTSAFGWAIGKPAGVNIVRLAAAWNFLPEWHQKSPKTDVFCFSANYLRFWYWNTYPG